MTGETTIYFDDGESGILQMIAHGKEVRYGIYLMFFWESVIRENFLLIFTGDGGSHALRDWYIDTTIHIYHDDNRGWLKCGIAQ